MPFSRVQHQGAVESGSLRSTIQNQAHRGESESGGVAALFGSWVLALIALILGICPEFPQIQGRA